MMLHNAWVCLTAQESLIHYVISFYTKNGDRDAAGKRVVEYVEGQKWLHDPAIVSLCEDVLLFKCEIGAMVTGQHGALVDSMMQRLRPKYKAKAWDAVGDIPHYLYRSGVSKKNLEDLAMRIKQSLPKDLNEIVDYEKFVSNDIQIYALQ